MVSTHDPSPLRQNLNNLSNFGLFDNPWSSIASEDTGTKKSTTAKSIVERVNGLRAKGNLNSPSLDPKLNRTPSDTDRRAFSGSALNSGTKNSFAPTGASDSPSTSNFTKSETGKSQIKSFSSRESTFPMPSYDVPAATDSSFFSILHRTGANVSSVKGHKFPFTFKPDASATHTVDSTSAPKAPSPFNSSSPLSQENGLAENFQDLPFKFSEAHPPRAKVIPEPMTGPKSFIPTYDVSSTKGTNPTPDTVASNAYTTPFTASPTSAAFQSRTDHFQATTKSPGTSPFSFTLPNNIANLDTSDHYGRSDRLRGLNAFSSQPHTIPPLAKDDAYYTSLFFPEINIPSFLSNSAESPAYSKTDASTFAPTSSSDEKRTTDLGSTVRKANVKSGPTSSSTSFDPLSKLKESELAELFKVLPFHLSRTYPPSPSRAEKGPATSSVHAVPAIKRKPSPGDYRYASERSAETDSSPTSNSKTNDTVPASGVDSELLEREKQRTLELEKELVSVKGQLTRLEIDLVRKESEIEGLREEKGKLVHENAEVREELAKSKRERSILEERLARTEEKVAELEGGIVELEDVIVDCGETIMMKDRELEKVKAGKKALEDGLNALVAV
ncbi:hypothetical protein VKT23_012392 [Stygiomarasmius scandens]|uniref:Uncharacterized protein n=1 Tax=Marasmiellus scandens TaxID=2682957 RepID=A0ABR1J8K6_9AGAR